MFAGVCNGLAAYFGFDPTIVRLLFIVLTVFSGGVVGLVYLVMMFVIPSAETAEQRAAASGEPFTTQEFIRRAKAGYYEGMKTFHDKRARREWRRRFKRDMRAWSDWFQWEMQAGARNWQRYWTPHPAFDAGWTLAMPFISLLRAALALACIVAVGSLLASGTILGHALPVALPVWGGVLLLLFAYTVIVLPLKVARHAYYHGGGWCAHRPFQHLWDALVWVGFCVAVLWLVMHHGAAARHAIHNIPPTVHEAVESIRQWWAQR
jgi:phage shock protein PspC (stress-responsive transcriptional regulator)